MARKPMTAAHKAAISAGLKRYWATKRASTPIKSEKTFATDKGTRITQSQAALIMFGSKGAPKRRKKRNRR